mmetsp:Transcript_106780/g.298913  ORF Transcript_106780/g.298913 Transcript_106780/m.298913 type:complete len:250 (+) Transcript_106780:693-1442(+)
MPCNSWRPTEATRSWWNEEYTMGVSSIVGAVAATDEATEGADAAAAPVATVATVAAPEPREAPGASNVPEAPTPAPAPEAVGVRGRLSWAPLLWWLGVAWSCEDCSCAAGAALSCSILSRSWRLSSCQARPRSASCRRAPRSSPASNRMSFFNRPSFASARDSSEMRWSFNARRFRSSCSSASSWATASSGLAPCAPPPAAPPTPPDGREPGPPPWVCGPRAARYPTELIGSNGVYGSEDGAAHARRGG